MSNPQLHNRRDQLVQIFESRWSDIGWELYKCKEPDQLIHILEPIAEPGTWLHHTLVVFYRPSSESGSGATVRRVRAEQRAMGEPIRAAEELNRQTEKRLLQINELVKKTKASGPEIHQIQERRAKEFEKAARDYKALLDKLRDLETRVRDLESSLARQELFRFLKSNRYALEPVNLANAAAGLPHMGWRQSMRRCSAIPSKIADSSRYENFKAIRYLTKIAKDQPEHTLATSFQKSIPNLPNRYRRAQAALAKNWMYLKDAIQQTDRINPDSKALPFEITKRYFKRIQSPSEVDLVLAEQFELKPPKTRRPLKRDPSTADL